VGIILPGVPWDPKEGFVAKNSKQKISGYCPFNVKSHGAFDKLKNCQRFLISCLGLSNNAKNVFDKSVETVP
jgi:hypothetical protein